MKKDKAAKPFAVKPGKKAPKPGKTKFAGKVDKKYGKGAG